ncbi:MFS transporter [Microbacterium sp. HD4P20]|uniref:MFS transporter n=1 Tax=Microbacterium sp. HD4P20 TaxID=2864874 RepID=UPI001C63D54D|nr:MFS transporter [Microbacterium sp. HD4P20]MCP2635743.1 MFS transporter [Microbacterium sp. HD4P20]
MKRAFSLRTASPVALIASGIALIAATYGLIRLAYGLFLPDIQAELNLDAATAGAISAGASLVYCVGALAGFVAASRHSRALVIAAGAAGGLGAAGMASAPDATAFAVFAIAGSAGAGLASPALVTVIERNVTAPGVGRAQAMVNAGTGPGLVAAGLLALVLLPQWRIAWFLTAGFTVAVAAVVLLLDRTSQAPLPRSRPLPPPGWYVAHGRVIAAALLLGTASAAVWNYGRVLLVASGMPESTSTLAWIALGVGGASVIATARWTGRLGPRATWALTCGALAAASTALVLAAVIAPVAILMCVVFGWAYTAATSALIGWTSLIDPARAPAGTALLFIVLVLGQAAGAAAAGWLITAVGSTPAFIASGVVAAAAASLALRLRRREQ